MKKRLSLLVFMAFVGAVSPPAHAADVTVIHGINGIDLGAARELPVDIAVNGQCALKGVKFAQSAKVSLDKGQYRVTVYPSNGACSAKSVIDQTLTIDDSNSFASLSVIASLTAAGAPRLAVYDNSRSYAFAPAVAVRHLALAPAVFAKIDPEGFAGRSAKKIANGDAGESYSVWDTKIAYKVTISTSRKGGVIKRLKGKTRTSQVAWRIFHIVGSLKNGLEIVQQDVR